MTSTWSAPLRPAAVRLPALAAALALAAAAPAGPARALEFPLTRSQRAQKLTEEGHVHILRGEYQSAIESCSKALEIRADWAPAFICRGEARMMSKDVNASLDAVEAARLDPRSGDPYRLLGIMDFEAGRFAEAVKNFDQALGRTKIRPDVISDVHYYRARCKFMLGQIEAALKDVDTGIGILRGVSGDYADWSFYALRGEIRRRVGDLAKADDDERLVVSLITERLKRRPGEAAELLKRRAHSYGLLRDYARAAEDFTVLIGMGEDDAKVRMDRAFVYSKDGKHAQAVEDLDRILAKDPKDVKALRMRAMEHLELGDEAGLAADMALFIDVHSDSQSPFMGRDVSSKLLDEYKAISPRPERSRPRGRRAFVLEMLGEHDDAVAAAVKSLTEYSGDVLGRIALARAALIMGRCAEVPGSLDWLAASLPASPVIRWLRGECRCATGDFARGLDDLDQAAGADTASRFFAARLAFNHRQLLDKQPDKASPEEARLLLRRFDRLRSFGPLGAALGLDRARTLLQAADFLQGRKLAKEKVRLLHEADDECAEVLRHDAANEAARKIRGDIQERLAAMPPPPAPKAPKTRPRSSPPRHKDVPAKRPLRR